MKDLFAGRDLDVEVINARMKGLMDQEGLPYGVRTHTYNSRLAQELGKWADLEHGGGLIHDVLYKAYFVEGKNIAEPDVLVEAAEAAGLPVDEAERALRERRFKDAVDRDWAKAKAQGVRGVPTFACGLDQIVGAQPYEVLAEFLAEAGAEPRAPESSG